MVSRPSRRIVILDQHDRNAVLHRIDATANLAFQLRSLQVLRQIAMVGRTYENLGESWIEKIHP